MSKLKFYYLRKFFCWEEYKWYINICNINFELIMKSKREKFKFLVFKVFKFLIWLYVTIFKIKNRKHWITIFYFSK